MAIQILKIQEVSTGISCGAEEKLFPGGVRGTSTAPKECCITLAGSECVYRCGSIESAHTESIDTELVLCDDAHLNPQANIAKRLH